MLRSHSSRFVMLLVIVALLAPVELGAAGRQRRKARRTPPPAPPELSWMVGAEAGLLMGGAWSVGWTAVPGAALVWRPRGSWRLDLGAGVLVAGRSRERTVSGSGFADLSVRTSLLGWGPELWLSAAYAARRWSAGVSLGGGFWRYDVEARSDAGIERASAPGMTLRGGASGALRLSPHHWLQLGLGWRRLGVDDPLLGVGDVGGVGVALGYHYTF